jgi:hypothetical protein
MNNEETIKKYVEEILKEFPETRDNDTLLQFNVLLRMGFAKMEGMTLKIDLGNIDSLPSFETIRRVRQFIQSPKGENRLYASKSVEKQRHKKEEYYNDYFSNKKSDVNTAKNSWMSY